MNVNEDTNSNEIKERKFKKKCPKNMEQTKCLPLSVIGYTIVVVLFCSHAEHYRPTTS